jgi:hypothetical protein
VYDAHPYMPRVLVLLRVVAAVEVESEVDPVAAAPAPQASRVPAPAPAYTPAPVNSASPRSVGMVLCLRSWPYFCLTVKDGELEQTPGVIHLWNRDGEWGNDRQQFHFDGAAGSVCLVSQPTKYVPYRVASTDTGNECMSSADLAKTSSSVGRELFTRY